MITVTVDWIQWLKYGGFFLLGGGVVYGWIVNRLRGMFG